MTHIIYAVGDSSDKTCRPSIVLSLGSQPSRSVGKTSDRSSKSTLSKLSVHRRECFAIDDV